MQIDFATSGGVANVELAYRADTNTMSEDQAKELETLVESSGVFDLEQDDTNSNTAIGRADVISYRLTLSEGRRQTTLWMNDITAPASVRPLLVYLRSRHWNKNGKTSKPYIPIIASRRFFTSVHSVSKML